MQITDDRVEAIARLICCPDGKCRRVPDDRYITQLPCSWPCHAEGAREVIEYLAPMIRAQALEEAAVWHDKQIKDLEHQIERNNEYNRKNGMLSSAANDHCRAVILEHRLAAAAIRALKETKEPS